MSEARARDAVLAFVAGRFGRLRLDGIERLDRGVGSARVFGVELEGAHARRALVIKCFGSPRTFAQERRALERWFGGRDELGGARVPRLLAADASLLTLVSERLAGAATREGSADELAIHRAAGSFLAALHRLELADEDPVPLAEALAERHRAWMRRCAGALDAVERRVAAEHAPRPESFTGVLRVPCHRDFTPDNWLWDRGSLAVVDFEHARPDLVESDLAKLAVGCWASRSELEQAFFEGYGRPLSTAERTRLRSAVVLHGLASLAWGLRHAAPEYVAEGRRALALAATW